MSGARRTPSPGAKRVKAHPATDAFMQGDVYGTIVAYYNKKIGDKLTEFVLVKMDRSGRDRKFLREDVIELGEAHAE